jgi:hypothetical protein
VQPMEERRPDYAALGHTIDYHGVVELSLPSHRFDHHQERSKPVSDSAVLMLLAGAGVISVLLFAVGGILEQLPDVLRSWQRVRKCLFLRPT